jgi:hypothetical protein
LKVFEHSSTHVSASFVNPDFQASDDEADGVDANAPDDGCDDGPVVDKDDPPPIEEVFESEDRVSIVVE